MRQVPCVERDLLVLVRRNYMHSGMVGDDGQSFANNGSADCVVFANAASEYQRVDATEHSGHRGNLFFD